MLKKIKTWLGAVDHVPAEIHQLFDVIVGRSRDPDFFLGFKVPDTLDGRFDTLVLHMFLVLKRLKDEGPKENEAAQHLMDLFVDNLDINLRAAGVSDIRIGKQMKKRLADFYGRLEAYDRALDNDDDRQLADSLDRNLFPDMAVDANHLTRLVSYLRGQHKHLSALSASDIAAGRFTFAPMAGEVAKDPSS